MCLLYMVISFCCEHVRVSYCNSTVSSGIEYKLQITQHLRVLLVSSFKPVRCALSRTMSLCLGLTSAISPVHGSYKDMAYVVSTLTDGRTTRTAHKYANKTTHLNTLAVAHL